MSELSDLEIRKMITEIEIERLFPKAKSVEFDRIQNCYWINVVGFESYPLLSPLTDDALCFRLMFEHEISIDHEERLCGKLVRVSNNSWEYLGNICYDENTSVNKAICLAIIELGEVSHD
tara:strand:+ start:1656 stop:2015 length:360 start_codon:yes stop_codon:yes gene_type:complete